MNEMKFRVTVTTYAGKRESRIMWGTSRKNIIKQLNKEIADGDCFTNPIIEQVTLTNRNSIVLGMGFGDEGKGLTTDYLASQNHLATVVRFSGGQQAGHTVILPGGHKHVFSTFGSGTLRGNATHISKFCTVDPICLVNEYNVLVEGGFIPRITIDPHCPITTPFEVWANRNDAANLEDGTCGKGIWATYKREQDGYSLWAMDLKYPKVVAAKLENLAKHYQVDLDMKRFYECVKFIVDNDIVKELDAANTDIIFEGSQGLLLDETHGFYPNITPSHTGLSNARQISSIEDIYLVTRAYQTRHGNGFMTNTDLPNNIKENPYEINVNNEYQKNFKRSILDLDLLNYALERHEIAKAVCGSTTVNLVITNLDQVEDAWCFTKDGELHSFSSRKEFIDGIVDGLNINFHSVITSSSPCSENYTQIDYNVFK